MAESREFLYQRTRWTVFASLFIGYSFYYFTRKTFTFSIPSIVKELKLTKENQHKLGIITSSYTITYGISKFIGGFLGDRVSCRGLFSSGLLLSALVNVTIGYSTSLWSLTVLWGINGLVQGVGWPPCATLIKNWFKPQEFGTLWSFLTASSNLAASLSPVIISYLLLNYGLSSAFTIPGGSAIIISAIVYKSIYNSPSEIGLDNIVSSDSRNTGETSVEENTSSITDVLRSPFLWVISFGYFMAAFVKFGVADWGQLYLIQNKERSQYDAGVAMSMFEVGGFIGSITSGYISDKLVAKFNDQTTASPRMPLVLVYILAMFMSLHVLRTVIVKETSKVIVGLTTFALGCSAMGPINMFGVLAVENSPAGLTSSTHGIVALAASVGAVMAGYPLSIITKFYDWDGMLILLQAVCLLTISVLLCTRHVNRNMSLSVKGKVE